MNLSGSKAVLAASIFLLVLSGEAFAQKRGGGGAAARPATSNRASNGSAGRNNAVRPSNNDRNLNTGNNRNVNSNNRNINSNNKNNIGNKNISNNNVNININNSKNIKVNNNRYTSVRHMPHYRPYPHPPYRYGGFRYYCYRPYFYHPYHPYVWGPVWHPWGFFVVTMATTAIIISVADADLPPAYVNDPGSLMAFSTPKADDFKISGPSYYFYEASLHTNPSAPFAEEYYYDEGVFYVKSEGGYTVVAAPVGATIKSLPKGYETVKLDDGTTNYYYGGAFYEKTSKGYTVVPPTAGTFVEHISDGGEEVSIDEVKYVKLGETYYQPVQENGKNGYEIANVEEDK